jgi:hypothetical protein
MRGMQESRDVRPLGICTGSGTTARDREKTVCGLN